MLFRDCFQHLYGVERKRIITYPGKLRLNRGERPDAMPYAVQAAIANVLSQQIGRTQEYPSYQVFYQRLVRFIERTEKLKFTEEQVVVGAGIEEFIRTLMFLCCDPWQKAAVLWPTCAMYDIYARAFDVHLVCIKPPPEPRYPVNVLIEQIPYDTRVLFLPNPGQPVETCYTLPELRSIARHCQACDTVFAVDEAHFGFGAPTALPLVKEFDNVIVMRTFSKFFGAASIRVGYCVGQERVIKPLHAVRPSGEITGPSLEIAQRLMDADMYECMMHWGARTRMSREWLREELKSLGLKVWGRFGFSLLIEGPSPGSALQIAKRLADCGVFVKTGFPPPVDNHILLACGNRIQMEEFIRTFKGVTGYE